MRWGAKRSDALRVGVTENLVTLGKNISVRYYRLRNGSNVCLLGFLPDAEREASSLGYSVGHWEGEQLVVSTTHIDWPYLDPYGTPQSNQVEYVERFNVSEDDTNLEYSITATDPVMFNSPITIELLRSWTPGIEVPPYNCLAEWDGSGGVDG